MMTDNDVDEDDGQKGGGGRDVCLGILLNAVSCEGFHCDKASCGSLP